MFYKHHKDNETDSREYVQQAEQRHTQKKVEWTKKKKLWSCAHAINAYTHVYGDQLNMLFTLTIATNDVSLAL